MVPKSLQMGWCESPPLFCLASETGQDVIEMLLQQENLPEHKFEAKMFDESYTDTVTPQEVARLIKVFVEDYIAVSNAATQQQLLHISRALLHGIHSIFPPPEVTGHDGEDPIAQKRWKKEKAFGMIAKRSWVGCLTAKFTLLRFRRKR